MGQIQYSHPMKKIECRLFLTVKYVDDRIKGDL